MTVAEPREQAFGLLLALWRGIPAGYKSRYRATIWRQFEDDVKAAAYTNNLSRFYQKISGRLGIALERSDMETVRAIIESGQDREILRALREDTALLILRVRLENQRRREQWLAGWKQEEEALQVSDEEFWPSG